LKCASQCCFSFFPSALSLQTRRHGHVCLSLHLACVNCCTVCLVLSSSGGSSYLPAWYPPARLVLSQMHPSRYCARLVASRHLCPGRRNVEFGTWYTHLGWDLVHALGLGDGRSLFSALLLFRMRLVRENKIFGCHIGYVEKMSRGVFRY
jgi:hypothetical protein